MNQLQEQLLINKDYENELLQLSEILDDLKKINEINNDLSVILSQQNEQIDKIEEIQEINIDTTEQSVNELEKAVSNKNKIIPMVIGAAVGVAVCGPGAIALGAKAGAGYIAASGGVIGGIAAKKIT